MAYNRSKIVIIHWMCNSITFMKSMQNSLTDQRYHYKNGRWSIIIVYFYNIKRNKER